MARYIFLVGAVACLALSVYCSDYQSKTASSQYEDSDDPRYSCDKTTADETINSGESINNNGGEDTDDGGDVECDDTEILDTCPSNCLKDYCPRNEAESRIQSCPTPKPCPKPACKCRFNYRRADNGTCIPTRECPPFACRRPNEVFNSCPPLCPSDNCTQATPTGKCPLPGRIGIVLECNPKCRCKPNYWRNKDGLCIPYGKCPGVCPKHEKYSYCMNKIRRRLNCTQVEQNSSSTRTQRSCIAGCVCEKPYLRGDNGTCVLSSQCDEAKTCKSNEVLVKCPDECPSDRCPKSEKEAAKTCPTIKSQVCRPSKCKCRPNYRRADNGTCIPTRDCPPFECTGPYEEYNPCPAYCPGESCSQATPDGKCPKSRGRIGIVLICKPKCTCIKGYWRLNGTCVPYGECPGVCDENETYSTCRSTCPPETCASLTARYKCTKQPPPDCDSGCVCKPGFKRTNLTEPCIPICECSQMMNTDQCLNKTEEYRR